MAANGGSENNATTMERTSDRETTVTRTINAPARIVFEAWTNPEHFKRWWTPKSYGMTIRSCEIDARTGGGYKLMISHPQYAPEPMPFFGWYLEVTPPSQLVWTNEEGGEAGPVTTVTFEEKDGRTLIVMRDLYPSKEALDAAMESGSTGGFEETFDQLEAFLAAGG
ncbi:MAG: SRPBCC domain-containing protein [Hyphomonadaceae bacterium]